MLFMLTRIVTIKVTILAFTHTFHSLASMSICSLLRSAESFLSEPNRLESTVLSLQRRSFYIPISAARPLRLPALPLA